MKLGAKPRGPQHRQTSLSLDFARDGSARWLQPEASRADGDRFEAFEAGFDCGAGVERL